MHFNISHSSVGILATFTIFDMTLKFPHSFTKLALQKTTCSKIFVYGFVWLTVNNGRREYSLLPARQVPLVLSTLHGYQTPCVAFTEITVPAGTK